MPAIDTDALVAIVTPTHPHHAAAAKRFDEAAQVFIHPAVAAEFTTVIRRQAHAAKLDGNRIARHHLQAILAQPRVQMAADIEHPAAVQRYMKTNSLSLADAFVAESRWSYDRQEPITFDKDVIKAAYRKDVI
jgi:predicted nucleic acid-binding protein